MGKKLTALLLSAFLLISVAVLTSTAALADTGAVTPVLSDAFNLLERGQLTKGNAAAHGNHQTRLVQTSKGTFLALITGEGQDAKQGSYHEIAMVHVANDGSVRTLTTDVVWGVSTTAVIMTDAREHVWMYSGYSLHNWETRLWEYLPETDEVILHEDSQYLRKGNAWGYPMALIDSERNKIYQVAPGGDKIGYFLWNEYDIATNTFSPICVAKLEGRFCYQYACPDGQGGFFMFDERDIMNGNAMSNIDGLRVRDAMTTYHSRKLDADYMWDECHLFHFSNPLEPELENIVFKPVQYDVEAGLYPDVKETSSDIWITSDGLCHFLLVLEDDAIAGTYAYHYIVDIQNHFAVLSCDRLAFMYGADDEYFHRFFEDSSGQLYLITKHAGVDKPLEIWKAVDGEQREFRLVYESRIPGMDGISSDVFILTGKRAGCAPSDQTTVLLSTRDSFYLFTIDFTALKEK